MKGALYGVSGFEGDITRWNVGNVINMNMMFCDASQFNQDISGWNISRNTNILNMFSDAENFRGEIVREHDPNTGLEEIKIVHHQEWMSL